MSPAPAEPPTSLGRRLRDVVRRHTARMLRQVGRRWPLHVGCGYLSHLPPFTTAAPPDGDVACRLRDGTTVYAMPDDFVGRALYYFGDFDPKISWLVEQLVREGDTVVDVGANLGLYAFLAANRVGLDGTVHAIEPQRPLVRLLSRSKETNGLANVQIHPVAFGDTFGTMKLYVPPGNAGAASLCREHTPDGERIPVPVVHAGAYLQLMDLPAIRLLKIDIEGYEPTVLQAAADVLADTPPDYIVAEVREWSAESEDPPLFRILRELGYSIYNIPRTPLRNVVERVPEGQMPAMPGHDILAARLTCRDEVRALLSVRPLRTD